MSREELVAAALPALIAHADSGAGDYALTRGHIGERDLSTYAGIVLDAVEALIVAESLRAHAVALRATEPTDEQWAHSVDEYRMAGWNGDPDDYELMFWEAGFRTGVRAAADRIGGGQP